MMEIFRHENLKALQITQIALQNGYGSVCFVDHYLHIWRGSHYPQEENSGRTRKVALTLAIVHQKTRRLNSCKPS